MTPLESLTPTLSHFAGSCYVQWYRGESKHKACSSPTTTPASLVTKTGNSKTTCWCSVISPTPQFKQSLQNMLQPLQKFSFQCCVHPECKPRKLVFCSHTSTNSGKSSLVSVISSTQSCTVLQPERCQVMVWLWKVTVALYLCPVTVTERSHTQTHTHTLHYNATLFFQSSDFTLYGLPVSTIDGNCWTELFTVYPTLKLIYVTCLPWHNYRGLHLMSTWSVKQLSLFLLQLWGSFAS